MDAQVKYIERIEEVARKAATYDLEILSNDIKNAWHALESASQGIAYDVLTSDNQEYGPVRSYMRDLLRLLYLVPGADKWQDDCIQLRKKDAEYGGSWCKRGGQGAFMMMARKWDRIELQLKKEGTLTNALEKDQRTEGIQDDFGDLRRYIILCLSWHSSKEDVGF